MERQFVDKIAEAFVAARKAGRALDAYPGEKPQTLAEAYAIQDRALMLWDDAVGGWKVGKIPPPRDAVLGANRLIGPIPEKMIFEEAGSPIPMPVRTEGRTRWNIQMSSSCTRSPATDTILGTCKPA